MISQLLEWLRWHFTDGERLSAEILREESPERHPEYWDCVRSKKLLLEFGLAISDTVKCCY